MTTPHGGSPREEQEAWAERFAEWVVNPGDLFLRDIGRIADALEALTGNAHCDGVNPETGQPCVLGEAHVGYHVPVDGRKPWLDTE